MKAQAGSVARCKVVQQLIRDVEGGGRLKCGIPVAALVSRVERGSRWTQDTPESRRTP